MDRTYTVWRFHGEEVLRNQNEARTCTENEDFDENLVGSDDDEMQEILEDIHRGSFQDQRDDEFTHVERTHVDEDDQDKFGRLFEDSKRKLYKGCKRYSVLLFVVKLLHIKVLTRLNNKGVTMMLKLIKDALPDDNLLPDSYYEARKLLSGIGMGYESIHACKNDCVLFRKQYKELDNCPVCSESRWKLNDGKGKRRARKVARYFPIKPRLQRLFMSRKTSSLMRWHKEGRIEEEGILSHPADGEAWKHFDKKFSWFTEDPRNVRLGLSSDGFNPFNNISSTYSMWPVVMVNYNMPPWLSKKEAYFMLSIIIPGPKSPGKEIDVYLQPLIEDLIHLFTNGLGTYDSITYECFQMYAALMWTISDFPAYGDLSGWVTTGKMACPCCRDETCSKSLRNKIGYLGHRRFLALDHSWRKMKSKFDGTIEKRLKPRELSGEEILDQLEAVKDVHMGKDPNKKKRKRGNEERNWSNKSIFYQLPYWKDHKLPHNLDFMHLVKNSCDNLLGTLLNTGKSKDTDKARDDLEDMGIRPKLHLVRENEEIVNKPVANYTVSTSQRRGFLEFLESVRYPDGYAANISNCVVLNKENKLVGLKSHDCHVLIQRMLTIGMRGYLDKKMYTIIYEVSKFFQDMSSRKLKLEDIDKLEENIVFILCKLEMIFPPAFFDIMIHLAVHMPNEARLGGPVQNRWMYPFKSHLGTLQGTVTNKAHPKGSIAEAFIMKESLTFCSQYLSGIETVFNRPDRYYGGEEQIEDRVSTFSHQVRPFGAATDATLDRELYRTMHWCKVLLFNCKDFLLREHEKKLMILYASNILERQKEQFAGWFRDKMVNSNDARDNLANEDLKALAVGPDLRYSMYSRCYVNGVKFLCKERDDRRKMQNCGVCVEGEHNDEYWEFYRVIKKIIELRYRGNRKVVLFDCEWYDSRTLQLDRFFTSVNLKKKWYENEPYILASQATEVFYVNDTKLGKDWAAVQVVQHRHKWDKNLTSKANNEEMDDSEREDGGRNEANQQDMIGNEKLVIDLDDI